MKHGEWLRRAGPFGNLQERRRQSDELIASLRRKIELTLAENRAALERVDAHNREYDRVEAIHTVTTNRLLEDLREAARRR